MILGIGTDIVEIARMSQALDNFGARFARRILTEEEMLEFDRHSAPEVFVAKRFAVKEAAAKALGTGFSHGVSWHHIEVTHDELGAPGLKFSGKALELQQQKGISNLHVSLSDERDYVVAYVILES